MGRKHYQPCDFFQTFDCLEGDSEILGALINKGIKDPKLYAKKSYKLWVRSADHLAEYYVGCRGLVMCSLSALDAFGFDTLREVTDKGRLLVVEDVNEPANTLSEASRRSVLTIDELCAQAYISRKQLFDAFDPLVPAQMGVIVQICRALKLDPRTVGVARKFLRRR